jgi:hypothetical protein
MSRKPRKSLAPAQVLDRARRSRAIPLQEAEDAEQRREARGFAANDGIAHEEGALPGALAAVPADVATARIGDIGPVELADPVVREPRPAADRARARLVADEPQGEVQPQPVARVSVVGDAHVGRLDAPEWYW